ncbi:MAG: hypothetical protein GY788_30060 [bacterium]|nr:hypothetical protein [bacterium]
MLGRNRRTRDDQAVLHHQMGLTRRMLVHKRTRWSIPLLALAMLATIAQPAGADESRGSANVPQEASDQVAVSFEDRHVEFEDPDGVSFRMKMPASKASERANEARYGAGSWSLVVEPNETGAVTLIEIVDKTAPDKYTFEFDLPKGWELEKPAESGAVTILDADGESVGAVAPPWAVDADGNALATSFAVHGKNRLVQTVDHDGAAYPVLADPSITFGRSIYFWFQGYEIGWGGIASAGYLQWFICYYSAGTLCGIATAAADTLVAALAVTFISDQCLYVIAFRQWLLPNYMERINKYGCSYFKHEIPG